MALNTEKCNAWVERDKKVFAPTQHLSYYPMVIKKVDQDVIYDEDDNQYIDFLSSASSLNLGSCNPIITAAVKEQHIRFYFHVHGNNAYACKDGSYAA